MSKGKQGEEPKKQLEIRIRAEMRGSPELQLFIVALLAAAEEERERQERDKENGGADI